MSKSMTRDIVTKTPLGKRQLREVLTNIFAGLIIVPEEIWLVTAWLTDFDVLDNRSGNWSFLNPEWGPKTVTFIELLEFAAHKGCKLNVVVKKDEINSKSVYRLKTNLRENTDFKILETEDLHKKGFLTQTCFLKGSMNFTYRGANLNDELISLTSDQHEISNMKIEFKNDYIFSYSPKSREIGDESSVTERPVGDEEDDYEFL
ncbi:phospholipase D-like domain-containing protein DpdK [Alteromonas sp. RKMC-009]|uniref:phospholipase D-like domain-containing protein DpdK n=1 Tax=Alteromonas sp. RKMC-009 TaxID=2267264 RepID=UPI001930E8E3|nr:phospholipase D-like domain-containing protein DpdK [Alteromonas sp. RKMC-009]